MKKVLLAFDGSAFSEGAFAFARWMNQREKVFLTGAFVPQVSLENLWSMSGGAMAGTAFIPLVEEEDAQEVQKNIKRFESLCEADGIACAVHRDFKGMAMQELIAESRFADLLVIGSEKFYTSSGDAMEFLGDLLHGVECPVVIVPEHFQTPENLVLAYDGGQSSVFACKQFVYLMPGLCKLPALLVYARHEEDAQLPEEEKMDEWASAHFTQLTMAKVTDSSREFFSERFRNRGNAMLVAGAFGRSALSRMLRKSFVADIIRMRSTPLFIAHC